jgi:hypothetical protein
MISSRFVAASRELANKTPFYSATFNLAKHNSTQAKSNLVLVDVNDKTGFSVVTLNSPPVNSLNLELLSAFRSTLDDLEKNNSRGMILTSVCFFFYHFLNSSKSSHDLIFVCSSTVIAHRFLRWTRHQRNVQA